MNFEMIQEALDVLQMEKTAYDLFALGLKKSMFQALKDWEIMKTIDRLAVVLSR